jgi:hypothetical protein
MFSLHINTPAFTQVTTWLKRALDVKRTSRESVNQSLTQDGILSTVTICTWRISGKIKFKFTTTKDTMVVQGAQLHCVVDKNQLKIFVHFVIYLKLIKFVHKKTSLMQY